MCGFANSVTEVLEVVDVLELLGFDNRTGAVVQDADSTARAISEAIEDITRAQARLHVTECFLRQPTLANYLAFMSAVPWVPETRTEMLADFGWFQAARKACPLEPASLGTDDAAAGE